MQLVMEFPGFTPEALFAHWTQPALLAAWWAPVAQVEPVRGGTFHLAWPAMGWHLRGRITAFQPPHVLGFTWRFDHEPGLPERTISLVIEAGARGGATLTLGDGPYGDTPEELADQQAHLDGWNYFLPALRKLQEG